MKKQNKKYMLIVTIIIILLIIITVILNQDNKKVDYSKMTEEERAVIIEEQINQIEKNELGKLGERDRIERYIASFVECIENKKYEDAYEMLYDDFKKNYFPNYVSFEEYAKQKFPFMISMDYTNIERNGNVYIVWVTMSDAIGDKDSAIEMNFVVQENDLNDFDLSFQVI